MTVSSASLYAHEAFVRALGGWRDASSGRLGASSSACSAHPDAGNTVGREEGGLSDATAAQQGERDASWVAATLAGNRQAFGRLVETYQRRVFALAHRYVGNQADAADLTQRAFLKAFESLDQLDRGAAFAAWIFRIVANLAKNEIRFRATKAFQDVDEMPLASNAARSEDLLAREKESQRLREALAKLPDKQRRCVLLRIDADLSFREIGDAVGCSEVAARVNFHHGLKALRDMLSEPS